MSETERLRKEAAQDYRRIAELEAVHDSWCEGLKEAVRETLYKQPPWSVATHDGNRTFIDLVFAADAVDRLLDRWAERNKL